MSEEGDLRFGPIGGKALHVCVDLQRLFAEETDWKTPWAERVLPNARRIVEAHPERTLFTRFVPARHPGEGQGTWRRYYERWSSMTLDELGEDMVELVPSLAAFVPPALVFDKAVYSPWMEPAFDEMLRSQGTDTLIVTGGETDVCVLGTVLGGVDRGYRMILVTDALCSSSDDAHDAQIEVYRRRYGQQVETIATENLLKQWT
ncbi:cysteine hydrolase family protein [Aureimonas ureilytica]|uniref:cysteine hydrolase family protein n=1 Tax=Aureimonas ureilytica TaxID=401562 RepID=UPI0003A21045|nr:cysteine hydrolase [Aureimonas ureilytica]